MMQLRCNSCGRHISSPVPDGTVLRAWAECPECGEVGDGRDEELAALRAELDALKSATSGWEFAAVAHAREQRDHWRKRYEDMRGAMELMLKSPKERMGYCEVRGLMDKTSTDWSGNPDWMTDEGWRKFIARAALAPGRDGDAHGG